MDYAIQIEQLTALLPLIQQSRTSLPSLITTISPNSQSPLQPLDLASLYRSASIQCEQSLKLLDERLKELEPVLREAEKSYEKDSNGIVLRQKVERNRWEQVGDVLGTSNGTTRNERKAFKVTREPPKTREQLAKFLREWESSHPRVRIRSAGSEDEDTEQVEMVVRGLMRVKLVLRWEEAEEGEGKTATVEITACFSLKENVSRSTSHQLSRYL